jgi:predicted ATP-grasp superfamily ATP-dependent carboligase
MYCDAVGWPLPANLEQKYTGVKWIYLRRDFQSAFYYWRRGELSLRDWWRSIRGRKAYAMFSWTDFLPFLADFVRVARLYSETETRQAGMHQELVSDARG